MGPLAQIFSTAEGVKRKLVDALRNPRDAAAQFVGNQADRARNLQGMTAAATDEFVNTGSLRGPAQSKLDQVVADAYSPMGIVGVEYARSLGKAAKLPNDDVFLQAVANTPGAKVADDGLLMRVQRNQAPQQAMQPSVRGGVFYLPEGASQAKYYSTGLNGYGGKNKVAGETLLQNPLFVKGATGGKAPEAAYDTLKGKGEYQAMRSEALNVYGFNRSDAMKTEMVEQFLQRHAPELSGQGKYIVENSRQGNQLAYALQEAAVASAARNAGYDSVLGYTKGKSGPTLSEVFDLRESHYPGLAGEFQTWQSGLMGVK